MNYRAEFYHHIFISNFHIWYKILEKEEKTSWNIWTEWLGDVEQNVEGTVAKEKHLTFYT